jgi:hypothetical protein
MSKRKEVWRVWVVVGGGVAGCGNSLQPISNRAQSRTRAEKNKLGGKDVLCASDIYLAARQNSRTARTSLADPLACYRLERLMRPPTLVPPSFG